MAARSATLSLRCASLAFAGVVTLFCGVIAPVWAQSTRIGYVDMRRLLASAPQVVESRRKLETEFQARDVALRAEQTRLVELEARERRDGATLPKPVADALKREIDALRTSIERTRKRLAEELKSRQDEEINRQWPLIEAAVIAHARENQLDLIVQAPVLYASAQIDVTDAVLARLKRESSAEPPR